MLSKSGEFIFHDSFSSGLELRTSIGICLTASPMTSKFLTTASSQWCGYRKITFQNYNLEDRFECGQRPEEYRLNKLYNHAASTKSRRIWGLRRGLMALNNTRSTGHRKALPEIVLTPYKRQKFYAQIRPQNRDRLRHFVCRVQKTQKDSSASRRTFEYPFGDHVSSSKFFLYPHYSAFLLQD